MNIKPIFSFLTAVTACAALVGCGGGSSPDDGQTPLRIEPSQVTLESAVPGCPVPGSSTVFVLGGVAPYSLRNPLPERISIDKDTVANTGEGVKITFTGGCLVTIPLIFIDRIGNTASVSLSYTAK